MARARNVGTLVLAIAAPVVLGATVVLVARQTSSATTVPVCIKSNGQVRVLIGANAICDPSEQRADWVVGGELTDITLGQGLTGSRQGGTLQLAVAPSLLQRGRVFSGYNDGPGLIPSDLTTIAELNVPAGSYSIFAKLTAENDLSGVGPTRIECRLGAGVDFDAAGAVVEEAVLPLVGYLDTLNLNVVHQFSVPGTVTLACQTFGFVQVARYSHLKIIAIEASSISNVLLGSQ